MGGRAGAGGRRAAGAGAWAGLGVDLGRMLALPPALRAALGRCAPRLPSAGGEPRALSSPAAEPIATEPARARAVEVDSILHKAMHHDFPRARAVRKRFKTSVKKLNLVCKLVRRARVDAALMQRTRLGGGETCVSDARANFEPHLQHNNNNKRPREA